MTRKIHQDDLPVDSRSLDSFNAPELRYNIFITNVTVVIFDDWEATSDDVDLKSVIHKAINSKNSPIHFYHLMVYK